MNKKCRQVVYSGNYVQIWGEDYNGNDILLLDGAAPIVANLVEMRGLEITETKDARPNYLLDNIIL